MIKNQFVSIILTIVFTLSAVLLYSKFAKDQGKLTLEAEQHFKTYQLLDVMHELQTYSTKFYFAGIARNKALALWYAWKLDRAVQIIKDRRIEPYAYNGWDAAELVKMLDTPISNINTVLKNEQWNKFASHFDTLMRTCNACHTATEHQFIIVKSPNGEPPQNQKFN
ncbi:MAG: hypothetical protein JKY14_01000 [Paraglaciecola sp.]|nr:hypothetical protein [Paraglaciecola sp.]